ncbi:AAA family ATPase [Noviherbaspirillum saxi]|uniref:Exonuclease SbcC n=1 Tax=Noviherbaspirillum saxi TaxID=2320863 RepID=A0A3A3FNL1_9BURK|nr:AAA family ATPase [Noviherbaspirillum saxi]RJF96065.1 exonuclease SbcC [Noviherbaspirillum saxi]
MKILKVCGKNLASLGGEFALDFQAEPLRSTGLFAICGPTGAGKSTLLDALCLALYDATPRLARAGSKGIGLPDVREETLTPQDTRTLLRRGSADAYAEVEFLGNDNQTYRARWSVRRARSKGDGALQNVGMSLWRMPELQQIGGTNREVKAEIELRIGLSFEQFTRAVLLAQNEFSAFLRADDGERGELLETLSGTAIYSTMSKRAYERAKVEQQALQQLGLRLADHAPLEQAARENLEQEAVQASAALGLLEQRKAALDHELRWHQAWETLRVGEQQARDEVERLVGEQLALAPRRRHLSRVESIQTARPLLHDLERAQAAIAAAGTDIQATEQQLEHALQQQTEAARALHDAEHALRAADAARAAANPDLDKARSLDAQIEALQPEHERTVEAVSKAQRAKDEADARLADNRRRRQLADVERQKAEAWLTQHASMQALAVNWSRWDTLLAQAADTSQEHDELRGKFSQLHAELDRKKSSSDEARARLASAVDAVVLATRHRDDTSRNLVRVDIIGVRDERRAMEARRDLLEQAERLWQAVFINQAAYDGHVAKVQTLASTVQEVEAESAALSQRIPPAKASLEQAERLLRIAQAECNENVEALRASLQDGQPCPVCGSADHPYAGSDHRLQAVLAGIEGEVARNRTNVEQLLEQHAKADAIVAESRRQYAALLQQKESVATSLSQGLAHWSVHPVAAEAAGIAPAACAEWIRGLRQACKLKLDAISQTELAADQAAQARDHAQQVLDEALRMQAALNDAAVRANAEADSAVAESSRLADKRADLAQRLDANLLQLDDAFNDGEWRKDWHSSPAAFRVACAEQVQRWLSSRTTSEDQAARMAELDHAGIALADSLARCADDLQQINAQLAAITTLLGEKRAARENLFDGRAAKEVEATLSFALEQARTQCEQHSQNVQQCGLKAARVGESRDQARQRLAALERETKSSQDRLDAWIDAYNQRADQQAGPLDSVQLESLLMHDDEWIASERRHLHEADAGLHSAKAVLQERQERRAAHEQARPSTESIEGLQDAMATLRTELDGSAARMAELKLAIADDDARRLRSAAMRDELERQQASTRLWSQLGELIGSADGKKFRNYAQQFTLDVLLGYANRHLAELARRYRLERIANTLALMVVDQDMGEEVRSVHSLSGGESFLVSLALALGLASLSSNRVRVESLFIDEGFGSLDADTLSVAMQALDGLQSMGRKVGVISHVQEMTERIATKIIVRRVAGGKSIVCIEGA